MGERGRGSEREGKETREKTVRGGNAGKTQNFVGVITEKKYGLQGRARTHGKKRECGYRGQGYMKSCRTRRDGWSGSVLRTSINSTGTQAAEASVLLFLALV